MMSVNSLYFKKFIMMQEIYNLGPYIRFPCFESLIARFLFVYRYSYRVPKVFCDFFDSLYGCFLRKKMTVCTKKRKTNAFFIYRTVEKLPDFQ